MQHVWASTPHTRSIKIPRARPIPNSCSLSLNTHQTDILLQPDRKCKCLYCREFAGYPELERLRWWCCCWCCETWPARGTARAILSPLLRGMFFFSRRSDLQVSGWKWQGISKAAFCKCRDNKFMPRESVSALCWRKITLQEREGCLFVCVSARVTIFRERFGE